MDLRVLLNLVLVSLFIRPALCNTQYINENNTFVVQSVTPCHLYGDSDIYGIGIRVGIYLQWGALIPALALGLDDEINNARRGFNIVALSVLINSLISIVGGSFALIEMFIVTLLIPALSLFFATPFGGKVDIKAFLLHEPISRPEAQVNAMTFREALKLIWQRAISGKWISRLEFDAYEKDRIGIGITLLINAVFLLAQPWLNYIIETQGRKTGCPSKVWIFGQIELYNGNWIRWLRAFSVGSVIFGAVFLGLGIATLVFGYQETLKEQKRIAAKNSRRTPTTVEDDVTERVINPPRSPAQRVYVFVVLFFKSIKKNQVRLVLQMVGVFIIAFIEMTIRVNRIDMSNDPITTTSQLLPLLVGIFTVVTLIWAISWEIWRIVVLEIKGNRQGVDSMAELARTRLEERNRGHGAV